MAVYDERGRFTPEKDIAMGYTWVIERGKGGRIAVDDEIKLHRDIVREVGFSDPTVQFPPVHDGGKLTYSFRRGFLIPQDFSTSTSPEALNGLKLGTPRFNEAFVAMRSVSAQMLADLIGEPITAEFRDGTSAQFFPQHKQQ